jgi:mRNA (guanine-N7-)-methyltransferase
MSENQELNKIYKELDEKTKKEIDQLQKQEFKEDVLKTLGDPVIIELYKTLKPSVKQKIDSYKIRDRIAILKQLTAKKELETKEAVVKITEVPVEQEESIDEIDNENVEPIKNEKKNNSNDRERKAFEKMVQLFYQSDPFIASSLKSAELEVRFGTKGIKYLTKNDYDDVIKKLKSLNFISNDSNGEYRLSIQNEFLDQNTGKFIMDRNTRTEIYGLAAIQSYCKTNNIQELIKSIPNSVKFTKKELVFDQNKNKVFPVNFPDFNFRVSYQIENKSPKSRNFIIQNWPKTKKTFRYMNRVSFQHADFPIIVDLSIVKMSEKDKKYYNLADANIFSKQEIYEIELEVDNTKIGPGTKFNNYSIILNGIRSCIKIILSGLQGTNYPISYPEQKMVLSHYMRLLHKDNFNPEKPVYPNNFIGPSSFTLQMENIEPVNENSNIPNIRNDFAVTDKADGERHLMFISGQGLQEEEGKIYLINTNMNVIFTGAKTNNRDLFNTLIDGELIYHDKKGQFINLFAAFDLYYLKGQDVRAFPFLLNNSEKTTNQNPEKTRYYLLKKAINSIKPLGVGVTVRKEELQEKEDQFKKLKDSFSPIRIKYKEFYPDSYDTNATTNTKSSIFNACNDILTKVRNDLFEYNTDGMIFTPAFLGVGSDKVGQAGPLSKVTWNYSFKWKPPQYNTIDFLVSTVKAANGQDIIKPIFEEGYNVHTPNQLTQYKTIQLKCTYSEKKHGTIYLNPCQDVIEDKLPEFKVVNYEDKNTNDAIPMQFYPVKPYDPSAGVCNILLRKDDNNTYQMFSEENEVFDNNTIVEFSYDFTREAGWRWNPLRVRHDKTAELRQGIKNYGNAYHVANSNWKSIHNPITEEMISTGLNIPEMTVDDDVYYNTGSGNFKTQALKDFHNLFVKKMLITNVSKRGDILIDYACGKAGDLPKWIHAQLSFVFGIDISKDNLENRLDGACVRYLESRKRNKNMPYALFVNGNSAFNIKSGAGLLNDKAIQTTKAIFGIDVAKDEDKLGKGVSRNYGIGKEGFNVSSCQFAIHYFFENPELLQGFLRNISECTKIGGYFIGTTYDGKTIYQLLKKKNPGETIQILDDNKKIWEITKGYDSSSLEDNSSSIGYRVDVFQESINQTIPEYLVNFDYMIRVMEDYGFQLIDREEAKELGFPHGSGLFNELFLNMLEEIKRNDKKRKDYGTAMNMSVFEKKISFLNRYFIFKKKRDVNTQKVQLELEEYTEEKNNEETKHSIEVAKEEVKRLKPKIVKLNKKLLLVPATEVSEGQTEEKVVTKKTKSIKPKKEPKKKVLIIQEDDENED